MTADAFWLTLITSIAGGFAGGLVALVIWRFQRKEAVREAARSAAQQESVFLGLTDDLRSLAYEQAGFAAATAMCHAMVQVQVLTEMRRPGVEVSTAGLEAASAFATIKRYAPDRATDAVDELGALMMDTTAAAAELRMDRPITGSMSDRIVRITELAFGIFEK